MAATIVAGFSATATTPAIGSEASAFRAFSVFEMLGGSVPTGNDSARKVGIITGPFFIDSGHGPVDSGSIECVATIDMDESSGRQAGEGQCVMTAPDGARLFAEWTCEGVRMVGCRGDFIVTGGDGRLEGVQGGGKMVTRLSEDSAEPVGGSEFARTVTRGIVFWEAFALDLP